MVVFFYKSSANGEIIWNGVFKQPLNDNLIYCI